MSVEEQAEQEKKMSDYDALLQKSALLREKSKRFEQMCQNKYERGKKERPKKETNTKEKVPAEVLRKIVRDHGDLSGQKFKKDKHAMLGAMKFLPHAIFKLLENMPMPWEQERKVNVVFHKTGALTIAKDTPKVIEPLFIAQWSTMWLMMRREKRDRKHFSRMRFPPFDDEEPPLDYSENIIGVEPLSAIQLEFDQEGDEEVSNYIYDSQPLKASEYSEGTGYRRWKVDQQMQADFLRLAGPLISERGEKNQGFLFDEASFKVSKALNQAIPGGPKFEPLNKKNVQDYEDEWNDFNDIDKVIMRQYLRSEYRVAFPFMYNNDTEGVEPVANQYPLSSLVDNDDPSIPAFSFNGQLNPIKKYNSFKGNRVEKVINEEEEEDLEELIKYANMQISQQQEGQMSQESQMLQQNMQEKLKERLRIMYGPKIFKQRSGRTRRAIDVSVIDYMVDRRCPPNEQIKVRISHQKIVKHKLLNQLHHKKPLSQKKRSVIKELAKSDYFELSRIDWLEAGLQLVRQGFNILNLFIHRRNLTFLHLDYNFSLKPVKTLTTKERKKSRFGNAFHILRELLRLTKMVVDAHAQYRMGNIDAYQLADGLHYIFTHVASLTALYRYKYKVMKQVRLCKDLKHVLYSNFRGGAVGKGPGCGFWLPAWRVWVFGIRGLVPMVEKWISNLLTRQFEGRAARQTIKTVTKQRIESNFDLELRASVLRDITDLLPEGLRAKKSKVILQHLSEAWRCWKANIDWRVKGMPALVERMVKKFVQQKAEWWTRQALITREGIQSNDIIDKAVCRKNQGRLARLYIMREQDRQRKYINEGPFLEPEEATRIYRMAVGWLEQRKFQAVSFPPVNYKHDTKILMLALDGLSAAYSIKSRLNQAQREELALIQQAKESPHECLSRIKRHLLSQRTFKDISLDFMDHYTHLEPLYLVDPLEKITDAYLDHYLQYECGKRGLFPHWIKPSDNEPLPLMVYKFTQSMSQEAGQWDTSTGDKMVLLSAQIDDFFRKVDLTFLNRLLKLVLDHNIADYMTAKFNTVITYKDMSFTNFYGAIKGLQFTSFITQYWGLLIDLMLLGVKRADQLAGNPFSPSSDFISPSADHINSHIRHPIRLYCRYIDKVYMLLMLNSDEQIELQQMYQGSDGEGQNISPMEYNNIKCWPKDQRMRLIGQDVQLGRAVLWQIGNRLPRGICSLDASTAFASVYSSHNPALLFSMAGFDVRLCPVERLAQQAEGFKDSAWEFEDVSTGRIISTAFIRVSEESMVVFRNRIKTILLSSGSATFTKIASKWNTSLLSMVTYYREAIIGTRELLELLVQSENKIQLKIKQGVNTKMPSRFPPVVFYAPKELGGLGMISMGHVLIPQADLLFSKQTEIQISHFRAGLTTNDERLIPNIYRYILSWQSEFQESLRVWSDYAIKRQQSIQENRRLTLEDLEDTFDCGVPRISTLFQRERMTLSYDKGWRLRREFKRYQLAKVNSFWWTDQQHDGKLWNLNSYRNDVIESLGGIEGILEHSLYRATYFQSWEGLFWEKSSGFEESMKFKKLTHAQRSGLNQIPNRRFVLWWSPTLNRANVYIGYTVQLDLTGIVMHGKLPTLKITLVQIFRAHLWQKIHESLVLDFCKVLDLKMQSLGIEGVQKETIHPRKSYKLNSSCADIVLRPVYKWRVSDPSLLFQTDEEYEAGTTTKYWIDIQLRWGDYDSHDPERYARAKFFEYTGDQTSLYPSSTGIVIVFDMAYNVFSAYGNWFAGLKSLISDACTQILKANPALFVLRERVRKTLQLYSSEPTVPYLSSSNYSELFSGQTMWFIDDSNVYRVLFHKTLEGNLSTKPVNGVLFIFSPRSGQLFAKIIHTSVWSGQKRLGQLAKWKAAEETVTLIKSLPEETHPKQLIVMRKALLDPLESHLIDFPNIVIKGSEMQIPFQSLLKLQIIGEVVSSAPEPQMLVFNLYDNWLESVSTYTAFSRLVLILRSLHITQEKTLTVLKSASNGHKNANHVFPTMTQEEWPQAEMEMRNIILQDFAKKANVKISQMTQTEIRDVILGMETAAQTVQSRLLEEVQKQEKEALGQLQTVTQTITKQGDKIVTQTTSPYEQQTFTSMTDWRNRALAATFFEQRCENIQVEKLEKGEGGSGSPEQMTNYVFASNIVKQLISISDLKTPIMAFAYGKEIAHTLANAQTLNVREIHCITIVPQTSTQFCCSFPPILPLDGDDYQGLQCFGIIVVTNEKRRKLTAWELFMSSKILTKEVNINKCPLIQKEGYWSVFIFSHYQGSVVISAHQLSQEGLKWAIQQGEGKTVQKLEEQLEGRVWSGMSNMSPVWMSGQFNGYVVIPDNDIWNYNFINIKFDNLPDDFFGYQASHPKDFFNPCHRISHFINFTKLVSRQTSLEEEENDEFYIN